jgi:uncharacterized membrane protein
MEGTATKGLERKSFWSTFLVGLAVMAAVDEIVFHQLLAWHHFWDRSTAIVGLISDGFLHSAELVSLVLGFMMFSRLRQSRELATRWARAGVFLGSGAFQLFDGLVDHKLLRLHQIRYGVDNLLMYDVVWNSFGLALLAVGAVLLMRARRVNA